MKRILRSGITLEGVDEGSGSFAKGRNALLALIMIMVTILILISGCSKKKDDPPPPPPLSCGLYYISYDADDGRWYARGNVVVNCVVDSAAVKHRPLIRNNCSGDDAHNGYETVDNYQLFCSNSVCTPQSRDRGVQYRSNGDEVLCGWETTREALELGNYEYSDLYY